MVRKHSAGGKHVAMERGLKPEWCGWPFRRELRELALAETRRAVAPGCSRDLKPEARPRVAIARSLPSYNGLSGLSLLVVRLSPTDPIR